MMIAPIFNMEVYLLRGPGYSLMGARLPYSGEANYFSLLMKQSGSMQSSWVSYKF